MAGILETDERSKAKTKSAPGALSLLLGAKASITDNDINIINKIHKFVTDAAVTAMVDGFNAEGAIVASRAVGSTDGQGEALPNLCLRVPPSCSVSSPLLFALYGQLSQLLDVDASTGVGVSEQRQLGDRWVWLYRVETEPHTSELVKCEQAPAIVAACFRSTRFEPWETAALSSLVASVAFTLGGNEQQFDLRRQVKADTTVTIKSRRGDQLGQNGGSANGPVEVCVQYQGVVDGAHPGVDGSISGTASDDDLLMAVALAAASLCPQDRNVVFAGSSEVAGHTVTIVMLTEAGTRPRLGVAVHEPGDLKGVVEAVLTTAS